MKVLFVGPTLFDLVFEGRLAVAPDIVCRPPASQGDIARATLEGANVIGLVDGRYEDVAAPWHKEILFALDQGVAVLGAGSLGALRAAECAAFGMIGIGQNFRRYASGELVDDADVAQLHAPTEFGCFPITEAFVNVEATIAQAKRVGDFTPEESGTLLRLARRIFFKELTLETVAEQFSQAPAAAETALTRLVRNRVDIKRVDALQLVKAMSALPDARDRNPRRWTMAKSKTWLTLLAQVRAELERSDNESGREKSPACATADPIAAAA